MTKHNKQILETANAAITNGDYEGFLAHCTEDTKWIFIGDRTLEGKEAVRNYMSEVYIEPPKFMVKYLIAENEFVTAVGTISMKGEDGTYTESDYCDVWRFRDGKMAELNGFVIEKQS